MSNNELKPTPPPISSGDLTCDHLRTLMAYAEEAYQGAKDNGADSWRNAAFNRWMETFNVKLPWERELASRPDSGMRGALGELFGIGSDARTDSVILENVRNAKRFADYLDAVEREFFMVPGEPDEDHPDTPPDPVCLVNRWGVTLKQYLVEFKAALETRAALSAPQEARENHAEEALEHVFRGVGLSHLPLPEPAYEPEDMASMILKAVGSAPQEAGAEPAVLIIDGFATDGRKCRYEFTELELGNRLHDPIQWAKDFLTEKYGEGFQWGYRIFPTASAAAPLVAPTQPLPEDVEAAVTYFETAPMHRDEGDCKITERHGKVLAAALRSGSTAKGEGEVL